MYGPHQYFTGATEQRRALDAVVRSEFFLAMELDLYDASVDAFAPIAVAAAAQNAVVAPSPRPEVAFNYIYSEFSGPNWNVWRSRNTAPHAGPREIFETIKTNFAEYSWGGKLNLTSFGKPEAARLQSRLETMRYIKPNLGYPIMPVSKFLHVYNPSLFPIYDTGVIYNRVLKGYWRSDFRDFCSDDRLPYSVFMDKDTVDFLPAYMRWANSLLSVAHIGFMQVFTDWLGEQPGTDLSRRKFDAKTLHARAFEYTVVGAATAEGW
jgi:hypothetical protein